MKPRRTSRKRQICWQKSGGAVAVGVSDHFDALTDEGASIRDATEAARSYGGDRGYDPATDIAGLGQPSLWVYGDADDSNPTMLDVEALEGLPGKEHRTVLVLPGVDHELVDTKTGTMSQAWVEPVKAFIAGS